MYTNASSTTYATLTNTDASTSYYYFYIRGFDFSSIPSGSTVDGFTVKIKGRASGAYNSSLYLCNGTSTISGATATQFPNSTSAATRTFSNGSLTWATINGYGANFGIRINCRRNAKNTQSYYYIYGAEIEVTYTPPTPGIGIYSKGGKNKWQEAEKAYKKINGVWVEQSDPTTVFNSSTNYIQGFIPLDL